jgi:RecA-family ATPase
LAQLSSGERNDALLRGLRYLSPKIAHGHLTVEEVHAALWRAYETNGYIDDDGAKAFEKTFKSGLKKLAHDASKPEPTLPERPLSGGMVSGVSGPGHANGSHYEHGLNGAESGSSAGAEAKGETREQIEDHFRPVQLGNLLRTPAPKRRWFVPDLIPAGQVTLITGDGGVGKSTLMLQLLAASATGTLWLGMDVKQCRAAILSAEDDIDEMHWRFQCINLGIEGDPEEKLQALNNVWLIDGSKDLDPTLANFEGKSKQLAPTDTLAKLKAFVEANAIEVLILDSAADVFTEEIDRYGVRSFIRLIRGLADTVILLGHPSVSGMQSGRNYSGSTHWNNAVRSRLAFTRAKGADGKELDTDLRFLEVAKANRSKAKQKLVLRWTENGFVRDEKAASGLDDLERRVKAEETFMKLLVLYCQQGRAPSPNVSSNFAPKVFAEDPDGDGISKDEFKRAMNQLLGCGKIEIVQVKKGRETRDRLKPVEGVIEPDRDKMTGKIGVQESLALRGIQAAIDKGLGFDHPISGCTPEDIVTARVVTGDDVMNALLDEGKGYDAICSFIEGTKGLAAKGLIKIDQSGTHVIYWLI